MKILWIRFKLFFLRLFHRKREYVVNRRTGQVLRVIEMTDDVITVAAPKSLRRWFHRVDTGAVGDDIVYMPERDFCQSPAETIIQLARTSQ